MKVDKKVVQYIGHDFVAEVRRTPGKRFVNLLKIER